MTSRRAKQIVYGALYVIILAAIAGGAYAAFGPRGPAAPAAPAATCPGADCGAAGIVVGGLTRFISSPGYGTLLARVENHNGGYAARSFGFTFNLYNASGTRLQSFRGGSFLYGGEVKYLVLPNVAVPPQVVRADLAVANPDWVPATSMGVAPQFGNPLPVTGSAVTGNILTVTGALMDSDPSAFTNIAIVAIFYGRDGIAVGASQTELDRILPGETEPFSVSYPYMPNMDPLATKLYGYALRP